MKLYEVTEIDKNDNVTRYFLTCRSRRDKRLDKDEIVKVDEIDIPFEAISQKMRDAKIDNIFIEHLLRCAKI